MDSNGEPGIVCLDVAIDHRIRKLFKPVSCSTRDAEHGNHVAILEARGHELNRNYHEITVTGELAAPTSTGGIAIALQQPRDHPFEMGTGAVIEDCDTLAACRDLFNVSSCYTLDILKDISMIDLLSYITETEMHLMDDDRKKKAFHTSVQIFCGKNPDVLLCAGKGYQGITKEKPASLRAKVCAIGHGYPCAP
jgi:hypothetical protein